MIKKQYIIILLSFICCNCFAQTSAIVDSINALIPGYVLDVDTAYPYHAYNSFWEADINGDGKREIVIAAAKIMDGTDEENYSDTNRIFVFAKSSHALCIIDSSADFAVDGRGPKISCEGSKLTVEHSFHHGSASCTYYFNRQLNKFMLVEIGYTEVSPQGGGSDLYDEYEDSYNVTTQMLTKRHWLESYGDGKVHKQDTKVTFLKRPKSLSLSLSGLKEPGAMDFF